MTETEINSPLIEDSSSFSTTIKKRLLLIGIAAAIVIIFWIGYKTFYDNQEWFKEKTIRDDLGKDTTDAWDLRKAIKNLIRKQNDALANFK